MIKLTVDEAFAFDFLSILEVKKLYGMDVENLLESYKIEISNQIGIDFFKKIHSSVEYSELLNHNKKTFDAVDKAKTDEVKASYVDECNYRRSLSKKKIQEKYFNNKLTELKHGYEKLKLDE